MRTGYRGVRRLHIHHQALALRTSGGARNIGTKSHSGERALSTSGGISFGLPAPEGFWADPGVAGQGGDGGVSGVREESGSVRAVFGGVGEG